MLDRLDTWVILALLAATLCCGLAAALSRSRTLAEQLHRREQDLRTAEQQTAEMRLERDLVRARDEAARCHAVRLREEEIEKLKLDIAAWEQKYRMLENAMNRMWPK